MTKQFLPAANFAQGGLNSDLQPWDLDISYLTHLNNVRIVNQQLKPFGGYKVWLDLPLDSIPGYIMHVGSTASNAWLICGRNNVYALGGNENFADVSSVAGYATIGDQTLWTGCMLSSIAVVNNPQHFPEYWPQPSLGVQLEPLPWDAGNTWADVGEQTQIVRSHKQFLFALGVTVGGIEYEDAVRWSTPADIGSVPASWDHLDTTNVAGLTNLGSDGGRIIDGLSLRDAFVVYRESSIHVFDYIGGNFIWRIRDLSSSNGLATKNGIVEVKGNHLIMGDGDILINDGNTIRSLMHDRIRNLFINEVNPEKYFRSYAIKNDILNEVWFCVPIKDAEYPNKAFVYNWNDDTWYTRSIPQDNTTTATEPVNPVVHANYGTQLAEGRGWGDQVETWAEIARRWSAAQVSPLSDVIVGVTRVGDVITSFQIIEDTGDPVILQTDEAFPDPVGMHFNPAGTKFYTLSSAGNEIAEYDCAPPYDLSTATFVQKFALGVENGAELTGLTMNEAGTKMWVASRSPNAITQYTLGVAEDVSSAVYDAVSLFDINAEVAAPAGLDYVPGGLRLLVGGQTSSVPPKAVIQELNLGAVDDGTVVTAGDFMMSGDAESSDSLGTVFNEDGTIVYASYYINSVFQGVFQTQLDFPYSLNANNIVDLAGQFALGITSIYWDDINDKLLTLTQFAGSPGDITTMGFKDRYETMGNQTADVWVSDDGLKGVILDINSRVSRSFEVGTSWDVTTIFNEVNEGILPGPTGGTPGPDRFHFSPDGLLVYYACRDLFSPFEDIVYRWTLPSPNVVTNNALNPADQEFDMRAAALAYGGALAGTVFVKYCLFSDDGTKMFSVAVSSFHIIQWSLSTPWDLNTMTIEGTWDMNINPPETTTLEVQFMSFSRDGTVLYMGWRTTTPTLFNQHFIQYTLDGPWDLLSGAPIYAGSVDIDLFDGDPGGGTFKPDELELWYAASAPDDIIAMELGAALGNGGGSGPPAESAIQTQTVVVETVTPADAGKLIYLDGGIRGGDNFVAFDTMIERIGFPLNSLGRVSTITRVYPHLVSVDDSDQPASDQLEIYVQLGSQDYPGATVRWKPAVRFRPYADRKVDVRTTGELHAFRVYSENSNKEWALSGMDIEWIDSGKR